MAGMNKKVRGIIYACVSIIILFRVVGGEVMRENLASSVGVFAVFFIVIAIIGELGHAMWRGLRHGSNRV
jgi:hypothetical protein